MSVLHALSALMYVYVADDVEFVGSLALEELLTHLQVTTNVFQVFQTSRHVDCNDVTYCHVVLYFGV